VLRSCIIMSSDRPTYAEVGERNIKDRREEARDLAQNPLPPLVIVDPLTRVWDLDKQIAERQREIEELTEQRKEAMNYALDNAIEEDSTCKLVVKKTVSTPNQKIDVAKIKTEMPKVWERIWELKRSEAKAVFDKFGTKIEENKVDLALSQKILEPALKAEGHALKEVLIPGGLPTTTYDYSVVPK